MARRTYSRYHLAFASKHGPASERRRRSCADRLPSGHGVSSQGVAEAKRRLRYTTRRSGYHSARPRPSKQDYRPYCRLRASRTDAACGRRPSLHARSALQGSRTATLHQRERLTARTGAPGPVTCRVGSTVNDSPSRSIRIGTGRTCMLPTCMRRVWPSGALKTSASKRASRPS